MPGKVSRSDAITASSTPWKRAVVRLSMTIASRPLIITLRHSLVADAMPSSSLAIFASNPIALISGSSAFASGPPSSSGTLMRYGGTLVITAPST